MERIQVLEKAQKKIVFQLIGHMFLTWLDYTMREKESFKATILFILILKKRINRWLNEFNP